MKRFGWAIGPAIALVVAIGIAWATTPRLVPIESRWLSDWDAVTTQRAYARLRAIGDSARAFREAWVLADARERAAREPAAPLGLTIRADADVPSAVRNLIEPRVRAEFDRLSDVPRSAIIVRFVLDTTEVALRRAVVIPVDSTSPCLVLIRLPRAPERYRPARDPQFLSTCGFYAAFGPAGRGMTEWLTRTRMQTAGIHTASALEHPVEPRELRRPNFWRWTDWQSLSCAAGRLLSCSRKLDGTLGPQSVWPSGQLLPPRRLTSSLRVAVFGGMGYLAAEDQTLAALRANIGDRRFAVLWRSGREPGATFAAIEGAPMEELIRNSLLRPGFRYEPGSGVRGWSLVVLLAAAVGLAALAITRSARQYVA